ncbi:MAG: CDP-alcohol phosphatidyltransferase family protein, partial [Firmicutes bacterium]|nr:CDP-alcohol phosphatidyltransferase family protein [Bacillota bacterium]
MLDNFKDKVRESGKAVQEKGAETASQIRKNIHNVEEKTGEVARRFRRALSNTPEMRALRRERIRRGIQNSREMNELRAERLRANVRLSKEAVRERIEQARADLAASRKSDDTEGWLDKNFHEPVALALSRVFIRLGLHPNVVTMMSMTCGVCGGALFLPRNIWLNILGVFLQIMAAILDCCDGQVARLTDQRSQLG